MFDNNNVKLIIQDEVNCKFDGLSPMVRREIINALSVMIPGAIYTPAYKLGRWNGRKDFMTTGGGTFINLLPKVLPILDKHNIQFEVVDQREPWNFEFEPIDENYFSYVEFPAGHHMEGQKIVLRDHQVNAVNSLLAERAAMLQASTSSGKTLISAALCKQLERYGRTILVVPSTDLVQQTYNDFDLVKLDTGVFYGDKKEIGNTHTITTWQSLHSLWTRTKKGEIEEDALLAFMDGVCAIVVDEAHTINGDALSEILSGVMRHIPLRYGMTGTIPKDEVAATKVLCNIGHVVCKITAKELQDKGILSTCNINCLRLKSTMQYKSYHDELKYLVSNPKRMKYIADMISAIAESGNTLVLVDRIEAGDLLCEYLNIPKSEFVRGDTSKNDRESSYGEIRWADNKILIATYGVASTGISISRLYNVVLLEPGKSFVRTIQSIGRGLRKAQDKDHVEIYDISGSNKFSARHLKERIAYYKESEYPYKITDFDGWE